ncbi:hypothetical protein NHX12_006013 [Muraenolepis orangiensis]|uniref:Sema domain-containing protein n=1 Tax=Muraenolepis orangiensis TaxID=630683 RepID=A0A9Q0ICH4_9TELE|nr:hypothetical protein NHX12_006013 [Muraenolepis orangiensis]
MMRLFILCVLFPAKVLGIHRSADPRMVFTKTDMSLRKMCPPDSRRINQAHVQLVAYGSNSVLMNTGQDLYYLDFLKDQCHQIRKCGGARQDKSCNITVLHRRSGTNQVFLCESSETGTGCCNMEVSNRSGSADCTPSPSVNGIEDTIKEYVLEAGSPSVLIESSESEELFVTQSTTENTIGIYKFGLNRVRPTTPENALLAVEHQYLGLVASRKGDSTQDKLYAFFKEKNTDRGLECDVWLPFVAQVCMADKGGPKSKLQFQWTSQLKARLFCGNQARRSHYPELVNVAFYLKEDGAVSKVYGLFRNIWGNSAVCVYSIDDIKKVFKTSMFKGNKESIPDPRPGTCTQRLTSQDNLMKTLSFVQSYPEMEGRVFSMNGSDPLLVSHHHYTHIVLDTVHNERNDTLLYLSLESGKVHKVLDNRGEAFVIAEYSPFSNRTHILDILIHGPERKLYVSSSSEVVQVDVQSCERYGSHCENCVLARDPYCGWDNTLSQCVSATRKTLQDVEKGDHTICQLRVNRATGGAAPLRPYGRAATGSVPERTSLPLGCRYFLRCPVSSHKAEYTWHRPGNATTACSATEPVCVLLIDRMGPEEEGVYRCTADELGYTRIVAHFHLVYSAAPALGLYGGSSGQGVWRVVGVSFLAVAALLVLHSS